MYNAKEILESRNVVGQVGEVVVTIQLSKFLKKDAFLVMVRRCDKNKLAACGDLDPVSCVSVLPFAALHIVPMDAGRLCLPRQIFEKQYIVAEGPVHHACGKNAFDDFWLTIGLWWGQDGHLQEAGGCLRRSR